MLTLWNFCGIAILWRLSLVACSDGIRKQSESSVSEDYCMLETFQPRCLKNEVILMKSATYGRMRIGRCIRAEEVAAFGDDPRYFGCSSDVLSILDGKCSGKRECDVRLSDISDKNISPCFSGLTVYLEVSYECISVADEERSCSVTASVVPTHVFVSALGLPRLCGTQFQPWTVEAPAGQKIRINLLDFSRSNPGQLCTSYGVIRDKSRKHNVSICGGGQQREKELHTSTGEAVEIYLNQDDQKKSNNSGKQFILKLEAVGCSDLIPPEDAWLKRSDDSIVIGCYSSRQTWHLHCEEEKWIGVFGNCSEVHYSAEKPQSNTDKWSDAQTLAMVGAGGITLIICIAVLCTGFICLRKFSVHDKTRDDRTTYFQVDSTRRQQTADKQIQFSTASASTGNNMQHLLGTQ